MQSICFLSLSRNPVCTQEQTGSQFIYERKNSKAGNKDNRSLHFHVANFFKFMAANQKHPVRHLSQKPLCAYNASRVFLGTSARPVQWFPFGTCRAARTQAYIWHRPPIPHRSFFESCAAPLRYSPWNAYTVLWSDRRRRYSDRSCIPYIPSRFVVLYISRAGIRDISRSCKFILDILPPLVSILHGLRALVGCGKDSAVC